jgi:hypothetical protein
MRGSGRRPQRGERRRKPRMVKGLLRIGAGTTLLYLVAGTDRSIKLNREDVRRLESDTGKHVEEMNDEEELIEAMERLGIEALSLTDDEKQMVFLASKYVLAGYFLTDQ